MTDQIGEFLTHKRLAVVGVSHQPKDFSRMLFRAFCDRNFDAVPVNPNSPEIEGKHCYPRIQDVEPAVDTALLMTSPAVTEEVVKDCAASGVRRVWMYRHSPAAEAFCASNGIAVIAGECPMMFLPQVGWIHRLHRWLRRV